ncbi:MAG: PAS domain S-box protein [Nitrospirae bacterium]|nr:MAG: PAS domain S-box protein [Nitrospirota bacterium]
MSQDLSSPPTILIVDDDSDIRIALTDLLRSEGHRVKAVETGREALHCIEHFSINTVILDVGLPDIDGLAVLQAMHEHHPRLPIILVTAHTTLERSLGPLDLHGAFAYLTKPYDREELKSTVRKALGLSALASRTEQIQRALGGSELRFRSVVESAPDAIVLADQKGNITNWNRAAEHQFGYTEAEVIGKPLTILMPSQYRDAHQRALHHVRSIEQSSLIGKTLELEGLRKDGSRFPIELSLGSWVTEEGIAFSGIIRDISWRKHIEQELRESHERLQTITDHVSDGLVYLDRAGTITWSNCQAGLLLGHPSEALAHRPFRTFLSPESATLMEPRLAGIQRNEPVPLQEDYRQIRPLRHSVWIEINATLVQKDEQVTGQLLAMRDVTAHIRMQQELQRRHMAQQTIAAISRRFLHASLETIDSEIVATLGVVGAMMDADRVSVILFDPEGQDVTNPYIWCAPETRAVPWEPDSLKSLSWVTGRLAQGASLDVPALSALPPEADRERAVLQTAQVHSLFALPLICNNTVIGALQLDAIAHPHRWDGDDRASLTMICEIIVNAIERKRLELIRQQQDARFRRLAERTNILPWEAEFATNRLSYIGPQARAWFGYDPEEWYEDHFWRDHIHVDDRETVLRVRREAAHHQSEYELEYRMYAADGRTVWVHDFVHVRRDSEGRPCTLHGFMIDITKRMQTQELLQAARQELGAILANLPLPVFILDRDTRILYANASAQQAFSPGSRPLGLLLQDVLTLPLEPWQRLQTDIAAFAQADPGPPGEGKFQARGRTFQYRLFDTGIPSACLSGIGLALWDRTDYHTLQDQLIQSEKLSGLGTLVSSMAHEMSNPMQAILGLTEHLTEETDPEVMQSLAQDLHRIGKHVTVVLRDFLAYVRPTAYSTTVPLDVNERLQKAVEMVHRGPHFGQVHVVTDFQNPLPPLLARQADLDQIFINLITNAVQAMNGRGRLTLATILTDTTIRIRIQDDGPGIPQDKLKKIFEPFFTTKPMGLGTGLGLCIVQKIVSKYCGTIEVESQLGRGTAFTLEFPLTFPTASMQEDS